MFKYFLFHSSQIQSIKVEMRQVHRLSSVLCRVPHYEPHLVHLIPEEEMRRCVAMVLPGCHSRQPVAQNLGDPSG
jgi:hypothetical protein